MFILTITLNIFGVFASIRCQTESNEKTRKKIQKNSHKHQIGFCLIRLFFLRTFPNRQSITEEYEKLELNKKSRMSELNGDSDVEFDLFNSE